VRKSLLVASATIVAAAVLLFGVRQLGARGAAFAFLIVWAPMTWLGTVSRVFQPRLPRQYHALRDFERDPWRYELLGVRLVKRLLRRGPLAVFNPGLRLPAERSPERLAELEQRMKDAEASHFVLLVVMLGVVINAAVRGWWVAAGLTLLFDVVMNGYPVMLQRYNRALLYARFPTVHAGTRAPLHQLPANSPVTQERQAPSHRPLRSVR
jgi:Glycosyl-4,4'-diaponeurosporenoate acyltransferase